MSLIERLKLESELKSTVSIGYQQVYRSIINTVRQQKYRKYRDTVELVPCNNECTLQACEAAMPKRT